MRLHGGWLSAAAMAVVWLVGCGRFGYDGTSAALDQDAGVHDASFDASARDAGPFDAGSHDDSGTPDAGFDAAVHDAGFDAGAWDAGFDAGPPDAGPPDAGPPCPTGMLLIEPATAPSFCIDITDRPALPFDTARTDCTSTGATLCGDDQWRLGCDLGGAAFMGYGDQWEWVDVLLSADVAKKRGFTCVDTSSHAIIDPYPYRCCTTP